MRLTYSEMITKAERCREITAVLARHSIGLFDDQFIKHEAGDQARAEHLRRARQRLGLPVKVPQLLIASPREATHDEDLC